MRSVPRTMTRTRRQAVFAGLDHPGAWPPTPRALRPDRLELGLHSLPGVAAVTQRKLGKLGLATVRDVLEHRPRRYETAADEVPIAALRQGEEVVVTGRVLNVEKRPLRGRRRTRIAARVDDGTATVSVTWFNQPWLADRLKPGTDVRLRGKLGRWGFEPRSYDIGDTRATADLAPVYPAAEEIAAATVRRVVDAALPLATHSPDPLPAELREREGLALKRDALVAVHGPRDLDEAETGRQRLAFEELLVLQIGIARRVAERERTRAPSLDAPGELIERYREVLPFALTPYQEQAIREIDGDLVRTVPMQRLLQGDVGSGKTVVALYALLRAVESGRQGALMAPTETLAEQHFLTIADLCLELGVSCALVTSSSGKREREAVFGADVVVGTHALIQESFELRDLAVAVVDEQHRFGVEQRSALVAGGVPNATVMIVQEADRFGLAQLHQLRGRVGRGAEQSYCLLVSRAKEELTESAHARLQALCETSDGFELAEADLELRGGGALLGTRQSGLSDLRFAHLRRDRDLLERARAVAPEVGPGPLQEAAAALFAEVEPEALA